MTLPIPLSVRLSNSRTDRHIERDLRSLSFRSVAPGGFASATFSLDRPLASSPDELAYYSDVDIYDMRNRNCVWCGRLEDPGRGVGADGQIWDLAAVGPSAHARDRTAPYIVVDSSLERWKQTYLSTRHSQVSQQEYDDETPALQLMFPPSSLVNQNDDCVIVYRHIWYAEQDIARVRLLVDNGASTANWENRIGTGVGTGGQTIRASAAWSTTQSTLSAAVGDGTNPIPAGQDVATIRIRRIAASFTTSTSGDAWGRLVGIFIRAVLKDAAGTDITSSGSYSLSSVRAHAVVNDLLGRFLNHYDGASASVSEDSTYPIIQLAYPDGVTPYDVLNDLMLLEPTFYWAAWERNSDGLFHFVWRQWPTTVRYEADAVDGFSSPGSAEGLFNAVTVRWLNEWGFARARRVTSTVPVLDDAGLTREAFIDMSQNVGSGADAQQAGEQFLAEHAVPPNAGTLVVARPIYDHDRGTSVMPWEIRPGHLIRVRGVQPNTDSLNATGRDGVTVFRVVAVNYDTGSAAATLELDSPPVTQAHQMAQANRGSISVSRPSAPRRR